MKRATDICPRFEAAAELLGKRWTGLLVQQLLAGPRRFSELASAIRVSERVLSERLKELEDSGVVVRKVHPEPPVRVEYRLTPKGEALSVVVEAIGAWANRWVEPKPARARKKTA